MRSDPAGLRIRRLISEEPLGGPVIRAPRNTTTPLRVSTTFHRRPEMFWSTSNSTSIRPSSCLAFSFQLAPLEHLPVLITPGSSWRAQPREAPPRLRVTR
jgi:hypothetical protein